MENNSSPLIKSIGKKNLNKLKLNILNNIYLIKNYYNPFFYCFQESSNYKDIIDLFEFKKSEYKYHIGFSCPEYILTIWNSLLFNDEIIYDGEFEKGRPFTLIIFKDLRFKINFILINIHASHNINTIKSIFHPIQNIINKNINKINKFNIKRIIIVGDFNRNISDEIRQNPKIFFLFINSIKFNFFSKITSNKTCCNLSGYGYNKNYDQIIDSYCEPILIHQMNKESKYISKSSDHLMILSIVKNAV